MRRVLLLLLAAATGAGCARPKVIVPHPLPAGDGIWFEDGVGSAAQDVEETLVRGGFAAVFLPAANLTRQENHWEAQQLLPPPRPFPRTKVFLVLTGDASVQQALGRPNTAGALGDVVWLAIKTILKDVRPYGSVAGVHLDFPFSASAVEGYGSLLSRLKPKMPRGTLLSISLRYSPSPQDREKTKALAAGCDGMVAFVFGEGNQAEPVAVDALETQWWAGYAPSARGVWRESSGEIRGTLPEWVLGRLSDDPRTEFLQNVSLKEDSGQSVDLRPRSPVSLEKEYSFAVGDQLSFRQPLVSDLIYHLSADPAGRRFARGRVVALPGRSEKERLFTLAALNDILAGKPAKPDLHVATETGRTFVAVSAENSSPHATVVSRTSNWVEVQIPSGGIRDVQVGGFDRFEVYGRYHEPVTLALATAVRFYETLIQAYEKIEPARVLLARSTPKGCCATSFHLLAASGQEVSSDTAAAGPPPR